MDEKKVAEFLGWLRGYVEAKKGGGIAEHIGERIEEELLKLGPQVLITHTLTQALAAQDPTQPVVKITPEMLGDGYRGPKFSLD